MTVNPPLNVEQAVRERYSSAAKQSEACLCTSVGYDANLLAVLPAEVIERDYGCGDPTRWVKPSETVLDLGSGSGKICFIAAQIVGPAGRVIGVDRNDDMLALARQSQRKVGDRLGYHNTAFYKGSIQDLALDLDCFDAYLREHPVRSAGDWLRAESHADLLRRTQPMIADGSVELVVSNCVLNLVGEGDRRQLFGELFRVLKPGGRAVISDIVSDRLAPQRLKDNPELWSGCISGAFVEEAFLAAFAAAGFEEIELVERQAAAWKVVEGIEFRSVTVRAYKPRS
jgi:arsenite methyltransferase